MASSTGKSGATGKAGSGSGSGQRKRPSSPPKDDVTASAPKAGSKSSTPRAGSKAKSSAAASPKPGSKSQAKAKPRGKSAPTPPRKSASTASTGSTARRRMPTVRPNGATVLVALVVILGIAVLAPTAQRYIAQRQYVAQLQAELAETQKSVDEIATERDRWSDPAYIQSQARGRLLFVMPGDTSYLVLDPPATTKQQQSNISTELHETQSSWLDSFVESLVTAGTAPAPTPSE